MKNIPFLFLLEVAELGYFKKKGNKQQKQQQWINIFWFTFNTFWFMLYSQLLLPSLERTHEQPRPRLRWRLHRKVCRLCHASPADTPWLGRSAHPACMSRASSLTPELTWLLPLLSAPTPHVGSVPPARLLSGLASETWILLQKTHWQEGQAKLQTLLGNKGTGQSQDSGVWVLQGSEVT